MSTIDLTTPAAALNYLRSLPVSEEISLPGLHESTTAGDAVRAITGENANVWANNRNQWEWTAGQLVTTLEAETAPEVAEILEVSSIHGELPGCVDVSIRNHSMVRVALQWDHVENGALTDSAAAHIESEVKRKGGFDDVEWNA